jgi:hypothetical protein
VCGGEYLFLVLIAAVHKIIINSSNYHKRGGGFFEA